MTPSLIPGHDTGSSVRSVFLSEEDEPVLLENAVAWGRGIAADREASAVTFHIAWAFLLYDLLKPVNSKVSLLAMFVILVGCAIQALTCLLYLAPLLVLQTGSALSAFTPQQVQDLALVFLKLNGQAFDVYLVFFGVWCVLIGSLIFRSTFLPRILGVLVMIDGLAWMLYLLPPLAQQLFPLIAVASGLAEFPFELWLIIMGVNSERWKEQEAAARASLST